MKLFVKSLLLSGAFIFSVSSLVCMNGMGKNHAKKAQAQNIQQQAAAPKSWADITKSTPSIVQSQINSGAQILKHGPSMQANQDDQFLSWIFEQSHEAPAPVIGNSMIIVFDESQIANCHIDGTKPVLVFELAALRHTLSPWFANGYQFVVGGHFARYLKKYADLEQETNTYFFNTKNATYIGENIELASIHQQHPKCEVILWGSKDNDAKQWAPVGIKPAFNEQVTISEVLHTSANFSIKMCDEDDNSNSFIINTQNLPRFKINARLKVKRGFYSITSIYPFCDGFESLTTNMYAYFNNRFAAPSDSILHELKLQN